MTARVMTKSTLDYPNNMCVSAMERLITRRFYFATHVIRYVTPRLVLSL